jgi:AraC-like DNA-binding protein
VPVASSRREPLVTAHIFAQLLDSSLLDAAAVARFHAVLQREGCDLPQMVRESVQTPLRWLHDVYPELNADQAALLGYGAGEQARLTSYSPLSLPLISATTIHDALRVLDFLPLISNSVSARLVERADDVATVITATCNDPVLDRFLIFYCASALARLLNLLAAASLDLTIHFGCPQPAGFERHLEWESGSLRFDAPLHYILMPYASLQARMASLGVSDDVVERLRNLLGKHGNLVSIEEAARQLHMSVSTLKRRLSEAHTSFRDLRESVLKDRAMLLLADASLSLQAIAEALGYSDLTNFSHAFKRWTGIAPGVFRSSSGGTGHSAR